MFSKSKINDPIEPAKDNAAPKAPAPAPSAPAGQSAAPSAAKPKMPPSVLSSDLTITGNVQTSGDVQVEGAVEGAAKSSPMTWSCMAGWSGACAGSRSA